MGFGRKLRNLKKKEDARKAKVTDAFENSGPLREVQAPDEDKAVLKEVPAKVWRFKGTPEEEFAVVGSAIIYDDGSIDIIYFEDQSNIPEWAVELLAATRGEYGAFYSLPKEGETDG